MASNEPSIEQMRMDLMRESLKDEIREEKGQGDFGPEQILFDTAAGFNRGFVTGLLGLPGDAVNYVAELAGADEPPMRLFTSQGMIDLGNRAGILREPETVVPGRVGRAMGSAAAALTPLGAAARATTPAQIPMVSRLPAETASRIERIKESVLGVGRPVRTPVQEFQQAPRAFTAAEQSAAASAGLAGGIVESALPEEKGLQIGAEIVGGLTNPVATASRLFPSAKKGVARSVRFITKRGAQERAAEALRRAAGSEQGVQDALRILNRPMEGVPGARLTPAQETRIPGFLALERQMLSDNAAVSRSYYDMARATMESMRRELGDVGSDVPTDVTADFLQDRVRYLTDLLDARSHMAQSNVLRRIREMQPGRSLEQINTIAKEEGQAALKAARAQESELWNSIDPEVLVTPSATRQVWADIQADLAEGGEAVIPAFVRQRMEGIKDQETVRDLYTGTGAFRSRIKGAIRKATAEQDFEQARVLRQMDEALLNDAGEAGVELAEATNFSRALNDRFTRGPWGKVLGFDRTGGARTEAEETLERLLVAGPRGTANLRQMTRAFDSDEIPPEMAERFNAATQDHLRNQFVSSAYDESTNTINRRMAQKFLADNQGMLIRYPQLQRDLAGAVDDAGRAERVVQSSDIRRKNVVDRRKSRAAMFVGDKPGREINRILTSRNPAGNLAELVRQVNKDESGTALLGLKHAFVHEMFGKAIVDSINEVGVPQLRSGSLRARWESVKPIAQRAKLFKDEEVARMEAVVATAERLDARVAEGVSLDDLLDAQPDAMTDLLARWAGATAGGASAVGQATGTPLVMAGVGSRKARELFQSAPLTRAGDILAESMTNRDLFRALLQQSKTPQGKAAIGARLNAFMVDLIPRDEMPEEPSPQ